VAKEPLVDFGFRIPSPGEGEAQQFSGSLGEGSQQPVSDAFRSKAESWKRQLLDVTRRNRAINFKSSRATLELPALPADLWDTLLVAEGTWRFEARNFAPDAPRPAEDDRALEAFAAANRLADRARLADREQGIQVLFAALGWLNWVDPEGHALRSPLVLIPVDLAYNRQEKEIRLQAAADDPPEVNPSLAYLLHAQSGIRLPKLEDEEGEPLHESLAAFLDAVRLVVAKQPNWTVELDGPLVDVFAFAKLAMVDEIDRSLSRMAAHPILQALAGESRLPEPAEPATSPLDTRFAPGVLHTVVDADAYQLEAVAMAAAGQSFVIEGPPGTGKSQTITNIAAEMMASGKRVLFVAEKRVAREVVLENLASAGLAEACLHLASNAGATNRADAKAQVIKEIVATLDAGSPLPPPDAALPQRYGEVRGRLNAYADALGAPLGEAGWTNAFEIIGKAVQLAPDRRENIAIPAIDGRSRFWMDDVLEEARTLDGFAPGDLQLLRGPWASFRWTSITGESQERLRSALTTLAALEATTTATANPLLGSALPPGSGQPIEGLEALAARLEKVAAFRKKAGSPLRFLNPGFYSARGDRKQYLADGYLENGNEGASAKALRATVESAKGALGVVAEAFGDAAPLTGTTSEISAWATPLVTETDRLPLIAEMAAPLGRLEPLGMRQAVAALLSDETTHGQLATVVPATVYGGWAYKLMQGGLSLTPDQHQRLVDSFARLDAEMIGWARSAVLAEVRARRPRSVNHSAMAPLVKYARAKRRPALRTMLGNSREAVQTLKPLLLMSPLAASQYLCHAGDQTYRFDAVIVDEASMIPTPDMVVALSLAPQAIIVGDSKQMPPTNFFNKEIAPVADDETGEEDITFESILDEAAPLIQSTMLRAHYRSRDESLIAFSNVHFYDGRLVAYPDAWGDRPESGVRFELVEDSVYGRGKSRANPGEAKRTIELLRSELEASGGKRHIAITAMSLAQQSEINDQLQDAAAFDPVLRTWVEGGGLIRNLETVQGDESDVMLLSVGYGKDADGRLFMNFGPLGQEKGERRLNVAVTRAKWKTILIASIRAGDIDPARTSSTGALRLRDYLDYAERGIEALPPGSTTTARALTPFELVVIEALQAQGLRCVPQVGVGGYRVDIAVGHPDDPERFVLAVETDGPSFYGAPQCRDRDFGRGKVLERMGWKPVRVYAPAWYRNPEAELQRVLDAYRAAIT